MWFAEVAATSAAVASTSSRTAKRDALADLLRKAGPGEVAPVVAFLVGEPDRAASAWGGGPCGRRTGRRPRSRP